MSNVNDLAAFLQSADEPASELETTGGTDEQEVIAQEADNETNQEIDEPELEAVSEEAEVEDLDEEQDPGEWHTVKVDGEELQVTLDEALKGYQRDADYRKKTMTLAEERKAITAEKTRISELVEQVDSFIKREEEAIDWDDLRHNDPAEYIAKQEEMGKAREIRQSALSEQQSQVQEQLQKEKGSLVELMGGEEWTQEKRNTDLTLAGEYLTQKGFKDDDISKIMDHRLWKVIFDAAKADKYQKTEAKVKEQVRKAPKSVKPGQKLPPEQRKLKQATERIKSARSSQDGVNGLAELIKLSRGS